MYRLQQHIFFGAILTLAVLSGCSKFVFQKVNPGEAGMSGNADWPFAGGSADRASQRNSGMALPLEERARLKMSSALGQNMVIGDGILYAPTLDGRLAAISLARMRIEVRRKLPQASEAACAVVDSSLVIAQRFGNKTLRHYNVRSGRLLWQIDGGDISTEPIIADSVIFCAALYKHVDAYRRHDGRRLWQYRTSSQIHASPALANGVLVVGLGDGLLLALDARTGAKKWELDTGKNKGDGLLPFAGGIYATPVCRRQTVYVGTIDQKFIAVDLFTGVERWRVPAGGKVIHAAAANDSLVIFGANDGSVRAVDAASGATRWEFRAGSVIGTSPIILGDQVFVGSLDHTLYCLDTRNGALLWHHALEGRIRTNPIVWERYLIAGSEDNLLYVFEAAAGDGSL